jgi:hypothetical protein
MANSPSIVGEDLDSTSQKIPLRSTADFFVAAKDNLMEFNLPKFSPQELLGLSFLKEFDGTKIRAKVINKINDVPQGN